MPRSLRSLAAAVSLSGLAGSCAAQRPAAAAAAAAAAPPDVAASVLAAMDRRADPCQDFYRFACGGWVDGARMPGDRTRWVRSFSVIDEDNRAFVRQALEAAAGDPGGDADRKRVGDFYAACMDEPAVEKAGLAPLAPWLARIAEVTDATSLLATAGALQAVGIRPLLNLAPLSDFHDPTRQILFLFQGGLGMPDRDYYVSEDPRKRELLAGYQRHVGAMLGLADAPGGEAGRQAAAVVAFETRLARASRDRTAMRDTEKLYHPMDRASLQQLTPRLPWDRFFEGLGRPELAALSVATPEFFTALETAAQETPPEVLRAYLRWHLLHGAVHALPARFAEEDFGFFGKALAGQKEMEPRWKRCVGATQAAMGEAVGKVYVAARFPGDSKKVALEMIGDIEDAFSGSLAGLAWMDDATRQRALEKKAAVANKIGYPDRWRDYSALSVSRADAFANFLAAARFEVKRRLDKVGKPTDRVEWNMTPQTVNAYYSPLQNEIVFPAGILQPPFFRRDQPAAMNYGAIGTVIGHELSHGFDDQGRKFDPQGRLREWWAPEVAARFEKQAQCVADQYGRYEIEPGVKVNGKLTLGENIADVAGLKQSWTAYQGWARRHGGAGPTVDGLTADQLFFVAHAQAWCTLIAPEEARLRLTTDPHSPSVFRVIGPIADHPAFGAAFRCPAGAPMNPVDKCLVW
jgi:endothelin-converting enzyme/putative endopeptidase